jgi:hypothetical protein
MSRPLRGQREVFRRLQERNEARRERTNEVRETVSGLDPSSHPLPGGASMQHTMMYTGNELEEFLSSAPSYSRDTMERLQREREEAQTLTFPIINGRTRNQNEYPGSITAWVNQYVEENRRHALGLGIQSAAYSYLSQAPVMYLDTEAGLPAGRIVTLSGTSNRGISRHLHSNYSMYDGVEEIFPLSDNDIQCNLGSEPIGFTEGLKDYMAYLAGRITHAEYQRRDKIRTIKEKENANNKDFKVLLEADY